VSKHPNEKVILSALSFGAETSSQVTGKHDDNLLQQRNINLFSMDGIETPYALSPPAIVKPYIS
jgi:hypothetical protein